MSWSIGARLVLLAAAGVGCVAAVAGVALAAESSQAASAEAANRVSRAMSRQWNADMMHDGLRADVMAALAARSQEQRAAFEVDAVDEHAATMVEQLRQAQSDAPAKLRDSYRRVIPRAIGYGDQARGLVRLGSIDPAGARAALPSFLETFGQLETSLGGIDAAMEKEVDASAGRSAAAGTRATRLTWLLSLLGVTAFGGLALAVYRSIRRPLDRVRRRVREMSTGDVDLAARLEESGPAELVDLAGGVNAFLDHLTSTIADIDTQVSQLAQAAGRLAGDTDRVDALAAACADQAQTAASSSEQLGGSVQSFAQGTAELGQSIAEIAQNTAHAAQVAADAFGLAGTATTVISELGRGAADIGSIAQLIDSIAAQTNLLALNATIEAARAGETGRGFAVVATEVKQLAHQVSAATADITARIQAVQAHTQQAVVTVEAITGVIGQVHDYQSSIAGAVEEQSAVSAELARSVREAADAAGLIGDSVAAMADTAQATTTSVHHSREATQQLAMSSTRLATILRDFAH